MSKHVKSNNVLKPIIVNALREKASNQYGTLKGLGRVTNVEEGPTGFSGCVLEMGKGGRGLLGHFFVDREAVYAAAVAAGVLKPGFTETPHRRASRRLYDLRGFLTNVANGEHFTDEELKSLCKGWADSIELIREDIDAAVGKKP